MMMIYSSRMRGGGSFRTTSAVGGMTCGCNNSKELKESGQVFEEGLEMNDEMNLLLWQWHSAGALTAIDVYSEASEGIAALIIVAPPILAPISACKVTVRMLIGKFGTATIRKSWYDASQGSYRVYKNTADRFCCSNTATWAKRLRQIACPVLIITGDTDRLVPTWNAERLHGLYQENSLRSLRIVVTCPKKKGQQRVVSVVETFVRRAFLGSEELSLQPSTRERFS
ncbi:hypothetical protein Nepgr_006838 [Nepenthes gracilis]|uniref:Uncharacterized protein n=1 Tax=Nepenthes gracilis TaxID=150966 RepID=A0AAD3S5S1_NEPGR|nr:hypothetical protein Nepgr_006838 [Nepenthes gracilis]